MVDAMTIQPISAGVALSDSANSGSTGVFDRVELKMARPPMRAMRTKKEGWAGFIGWRAGRFFENVVRNRMACERIDDTPSPRRTPGSSFNQLDLTSVGMTNETCPAFPDYPLRRI